MKMKHIIEILTSDYETNDKLIDINLSSEELIQVYPLSVNMYKEYCLFIAKSGIEKYLYIYSENTEGDFCDKFEGENLYPDLSNSKILIKKCLLNHCNAELIRQTFDFTKPELIGLKNSFGFGDRIGLSGPGHIRALIHSEMKPVFAQQSVRELVRTERNPGAIIDSATWAVFQEGFRNGFGADADHLKTTDDIDFMILAGYTMITIDPGEHVNDDSGSLSEAELLYEAENLHWGVLEDSCENVLRKYEKRRFIIDDTFSLQPGKMEVLRAMVKYGGVIVHTLKMYRYIKHKYSDKSFELELSVDETDSPTTPFEHLFIVHELKRLNIDLDGIAPRFIGDFEKGIDYKNDLNVFMDEFLKHVKISEYLGPYKISFHSGSDKFSVYKQVGLLNRGFLHIKTAGTSYLEVLRAIANVDESLFREIYDFSRERFNIERKTYHVSADINNLLPAKEYKTDDLLDLLNNDDARQVLHVAFGIVLTIKDQQGSFIYKDRIIKCLKVNESLHYKIIKDHFIRHLEPFAK
jgi:hypothetical protein